MATPTHNNWTADDSRDGPLRSAHEYIESLIFDLRRGGYLDDDRVGILVALRDVMRNHRGWARDIGFLRMLQESLDDAYDIVVAVAPCWAPGNALDQLIGLHAQVTLLWIAAERTNASRERPVAVVRGRRRLLSARRRGRS